MSNKEDKVNELAKGIGGGLGYFLGLLTKLGVLWFGIWILYRFDLLNFLTVS